ncbi:MAG: hypothetical protein IJG82_09260 [Atopobiaceae bacterium]|nr:hypothetical protein [Atopobiaceae bacterium]
MTYVVIELQTDEQGHTANITTAHETLEQAYSKYHAVLSAAAVSSVPYHAAVLLDHAGLQLAQWCFEHIEQ